MIIPTKYKTIIGNENLRSASLADLLDFQEGLFKESKLLQIAKKSPIYKNKWKNVKNNFKKVNFETLTTLPFINDDDIGQFNKKFNKTLMEIPRHWFYNKGNTKTSWVPYSTLDTYTLFNLIDRALRVIGCKDDDIILNSDFSAPAFGDMLPYLIAYSQILKKDEKLKTEIVSVSLDLLLMGMNRLDFTMRRKPSILLMRPSTAVKIVEYLPGPLENLKKGVFYGEPVADYRDEIEKHYSGIEIYEMYAKVENIGFNVECKAHNGVHLWLDNCIPEIIPEEELEKERENVDYMPSATHLSHTKKGVSGELVLTMFREAFPLVRYRTGDIIKIEDVKACECGMSHPRVSFNKKDVDIHKEYKTLDLETAFSV